MRRCATAKEGRRLATPFDISRVLHSRSPGAPPLTLLGLFGKKARFIYLK
jgi:hypothetical protein